MDDPCGPNGRSSRIIGLDMTGRGVVERDFNGVVVEALLIQLNPISISYR